MVKTKEDLMNNLKEKLLTKFKGKVFSSNDVLQTLCVFLKRDIEEAMVQLTREKKIVHLTENLFAIPVYSKVIDEYSYPPIEEFTEALARNKDIRLVPIGALAENLLGFSTQVPNTYIFASDGPDMTLDYFGQKISIEHDKRVDRDISVEFNALILMEGELD